MDRDHRLLGGIIVPAERHLLRTFEVRCSEIQVTDHIFINNFFLEKLMDAHAPSASAWGCPCIFAYRGWKSPIAFLLPTPSGGTPSNINVIYASLKSTFSGLQFCRWQYRSIFICLAAVASQTNEITQNSEKIQTYNSSRSSKVIDLGANRKCICNFLLVNNSNFGRISYRFRDIDA